jgi:hypothetical protein
MALFGLSPLFLSLIASEGFTSPTAGLDVTRFLKFVAMLTGSTHLIGAFTLRTPAIRGDFLIPSQPDSEQEVNERSSLLPGSMVEGKPAQPNHGSVVKLFSDPCFWILAMILVVALGSVSRINSQARTNCLLLIVRDGDIEHGNHRAVASAIIAIVTRNTLNCYRYCNTS